MTRLSPSDIRFEDVLPHGYALVGDPIAETTKAARFSYGNKYIWIPKIAARVLSNGSYCAAQWAIKSALAHESTEEFQR